ncbi:magnesium ion transporter [Leucoagaricus gongylophorus]
MERFISPFRNYIGTRHVSWLLRSRTRPADSNGVLEDQEDLTKAAILEKVMKGRQPTDLMLRCTILDAEGASTHTPAYDFADMIAHSRKCQDDLWSLQKVRLDCGTWARDLRKIDSRVPNLIPTILVRREAVLVNILHIRALVKADTVILFDTYGSADSRLHSVFLYHLEHNLKLRGTTLPYEFRALESILLSVMSALEAEMVFIRNLVGGLLAELEDNIDHDRFKRLLHYSRRLVSFKNRAKLVEEALEEVLAQDEDLNAMYLSNRRGDLQESDHDELELLLESFSKQVEEIVTEAESIETNVQSTQEIVELILDSNRNALLALDLKVSIATMGLGTGALVAGLFGMNLTSHMEEHPYAFYLMTCLSSGVALIVTWVALHKYISSSSSKKTVSDALILGSLKSDVLASRVLKIWVGKQPNPGFPYHLEEGFQRVGRETPSELDVTGSLSDITSIPDLQCHGSADHRSPCRISMLGSQELI